MGHGKLKKFAENETFRCLLQPAAEEVLAGRGRDFRLKDHPVKGQWNARMFDTPQPIVLELGCGRGEYCIGLSRRNPGCNYIGVDIKGARLWKGAKEATECNMGNVAFLRTRIEFIEAFFAPEEVSEIWLTFSDPQLHHENSRLTSPLFLERYRGFLKRGGLIHLKTDSRFLYEYTLALCKENGLDILAATDDLYGGSFDVSNLSPDAADALLGVHTYYETMFSRQGYKITYLCFRLQSTAAHGDAGPVLCGPMSFDVDYWRSVEGPRHSIALPDFSL